MILKFPGGVAPGKKSEQLLDKTVSAEDCPAVCLEIPAGAGVKCAVAENGDVTRGSLVAVIDGTPVFSPVSGAFKGRLENAGKEHFVIVSDRQLRTTRIFAPESRELTSLSYSDILKSARQFGITDCRSGMPLWKLMESVKKPCLRVIIDCTESDPLSAAAARVCIENTRAVIGGAKILLQAFSAAKAVVAAEAGRARVFEAFARRLNGESPIVTARLEEKYPYNDRAIMQALYVKELGRNETAAAKGYLIVSAECAAALYECMATGMPMLYRHIGFYGEGVSHPANLKVPCGMTVHDIAGLCGGMPRKVPVTENSLLNGAPAGGAVTASTRAYIARKPEKLRRTPCIGCGKCVEACPVKLIPAAALGKVTEEMVKNCISCGACEYICPSGIPLASMIKKHRADRAGGTEVKDDK